jgi:hypothetical protein
MLVVKKYIHTYLRMKEKMKMYALFLYNLPYGIV